LANRKNKVDSTQTNRISTQKEQAVPIVFNSQGKEYLHKFFQQIDKANRKKISVLHYGDSQIEADRITSYLRTKNSGCSLAVNRTGDFHTG